MAKTIDYRSDFSFLLEITDKKGNVLPLRDLDFEGHAYTALKPGFAFRRKGGKAVHCMMRGDKVLVVCDAHRLHPGTVKVELRVEYPDDLYPDGIRTEVHCFDTDIRLAGGCGCGGEHETGTAADVEVVTPQVLTPTAFPSFYIVQKNVSPLSLRDEMMPQGAAFTVRLCTYTPPGGSGMAGGFYACCAKLLRLTSIGPSKIKVVAAVHRLTGLGLQESKRLVESAPTYIPLDNIKEDAYETLLSDFLREIEELGGECEYQSGGLYRYFPGSETYNDVSNEERYALCEPGVYHCTEDGCFYKVSQAGGGDIEIVRIRTVLGDGAVVPEADLRGLTQISCEGLSGRAVVNGEYVSCDELRVRGDIRGLEARGYVPYLFRRVCKSNRRKNRSDDRVSVDRSPKRGGWQLCGKGDTIKVDAETGVVSFRQREQAGKGEPECYNWQYVDRWEKEARSALHIGHHAANGINGNEFDYVRWGKSRLELTLTPRRFRFAIGYGLPLNHPARSVRPEELATNLAQFTIVGGLNCQTGEQVWRFGY